MCKIVGDKITTFEEQVDVVGCPALHAVGCCYPCCVLWRTPVELGSDFAAQLLDGALDCLVGVAPLCARVYALLSIIVVVVSA